MELSNNEKKALDVAQVVKGKKVVLFGTGNVSTIIANSVSFNIAYYVDNDNKKWDMIFGESVICSPKKLLDEDRDKLRIFIASTYSDEIAKQLESMGFIEGIHFWNGCEVFVNILEKVLSIKSPCVEELLKKNSLLKNIHQGKRCFIIANGPSLTNQNLLMLKDDIKIVVNSFYWHPLLSELHPEYWVVADPLYWTKWEGFLLPLLEQLSEKNVKTKLFMPSNGAELLRSKTSDSSNIDPHIFHYKWNKNSIEDVDLSKDIPPWGENVIVPALMLSFHLGCENIYLLGCDHDWWGYTKGKFREDCSKYSHFHQQSTCLNSKAYAEEFTFEQLAKSIVTQRKQYEFLKEYGEKTGQYIYNATEGGLLDIFPRVQYMSLFE